MQVGEGGGPGMGPIAVGFLSDILASSLGQESLRFSLLIFSPGYMWCAYHEWKTADTIEDDIHRVEVAAAAKKQKALQRLSANAPTGLAANG